MISRKQLERIAAAIQGVPVWGCLPNSTSANAGVRFGDIVLSVNGVRTHTIDDYLKARHLRDDGMALRLFRAGQEFEIFVEFCAPAASREQRGSRVTDGHDVTAGPGAPVRQVKPN